jgi:hypothetical protein
VDKEASYLNIQEVFTQKGEFLETKERGWSIDE